jgi:hypothetical protein
VAPAEEWETSSRWRAISDSRVWRVRPSINPRSVVESSPAAARSEAFPPSSVARALELILGSVVIDAATAELYGIVNRALPEAEIQDNVNELASKIAGHDRRVIAEAKTLVDQQTLPTDPDLVTAYQTFFASVARRTA